MASSSSPSSTQPAASPTHVPPSCSGTSPPSPPSASLPHSASGLSPILPSASSSGQSTLSGVPLIKKPTAFVQLSVSCKGTQCGPSKTISQHTSNEERKDVP